MSKLPNARTREKFHKHGGDDPGLDHYLAQIGKAPLITHEEEIRLSKKIQAGNVKAFNKLVNANLRFVVSVAKKYQNQGLLLSDLINEGNMGLMKAAKRFDGSRGFKFISYAVWWIRQAILQALAEQSRIVRLPLNRVGVLHKIGKANAALVQEFGREPTDEEIAEATEFSLDEVRQTAHIASSHLSLDKPSEEGNDETALINILGDLTAPSAEEELIARELVVIIEQALDTLTPREAEVLKLYFGLHDDTPLTLEDIGQRFSLTRERVRQIKEKALRRLRHSSRSRIMRPYYFNNDHST